MPDLGKYADTVAWAYAVSILLLVVLVVMSLRRGRKVRTEMEELEARMTRDG